MAASGEWQLLALMLVMCLLVLYMVWRWRLVILELRADAGGEVVEQRCRQLLRDLLSDEELQELEATGFLMVRSASVPGRTYRIPSAGGSVVVQEPNASTMLLCVQPVARLPRADIVLMHKLMIEGNEEEYLRVANVQQDPCFRPPLAFRARR
jgi:hypothetical protein